MRAAGAILGILVVLVIGYFIFKLQFAAGPGGKVTSPKEQIDVVGVKMDLEAIAHAERLYLASHGSYTDVNQLQQDGAIAFSGTNRRGYNYTATIDDGQHFKITATPADPAKLDWPTLSIDDTMQVAQQ